jgi:hypothetical protein
MVVLISTCSSTPPRSRNPSALLARGRPTSRDRPSTSWYQRNATLTLGGEAVFADPESGLEGQCGPCGRRGRPYRDTVEEAIGEWRDLLQSTGAGYGSVSRRTCSFGVPLRKAFAARQRLP